MVRLAIVLLLGYGLLGGGCGPAPSPSERLPGAAPVDPALARRLAAAVARHSPGDLAHTRHRRNDGTPRYTNRLILEASPYLQQHAHNPVDWYPWGEEAFARARAESKPVLLSVGYATCHWCHVMAAESFEDEEVAAYLNANYVAIKVDREERPDIDANYLTAVELMSGRGGWPMTVWLTPARDPFFGGTYFPARDGERGVRTGFLTRLRQLREAFDTTPAAVGEQAGTLAARVRALAAPAAGTTLPDATVLHAAFGAYAASFDAVHGGFGRAPKFPMPVALDFLLRYHRRTRTPAALTMVTRTLEAMAAGGVHDQLGGGFHRYATDPAWQVPHFEKMLYDNAQLALVYLAAFQVTGRDDFRRVVRTTLDYLERDLSAPGGGFYAASDADSDGGEGRFFVWTPAEVAAVLPPATAAAVSAYYGVTPGGNFDGHTILHVVRPLEAVAADLGTPPAELAALVEAARPRLLAARAARVPPAVDTKVLTAWNGLAISAFARAGAVLGSTADVERARRAAAFALDHLRPGGRLKRSFADGAAHEDAFLDDYAMLAAGLLDLYEATFELRWLRAALALHAELAREFADDAGGGFFTTGAGREVVLARAKPLDDGALPSGNAVAAETLLGLAELTGDDRPRARADGVLRALAPLLARAPTAAARALAALERRLDRTKEVVLVAPRPGDPGLAALLAIVRAAYLPNHVLTATSEGPELAAQQELIPLAGDKRALRGLATAYVCEAGTCAAPTTDATVLAAQLATVQPLADAAGAETP